MLLLASALIVVAMAAVNASPAFANNNRSDNQLRNRIDRIQDRPGPLTNHEKHQIDVLRDDRSDNNQRHNNFNSPFRFNHGFNDGFFFSPFTTFGFANSFCPFFGDFDGPVNQFDCFH